MIRLSVAIAAAVAGTFLVSAGDNKIHTFTKKHITPHFWAEGAYWGDFNHDGKMDLVYGPFWFEGPSFEKRHEYADATASFKHKKTDGTEETIPGFEGALGVNNAYSKNFLEYTADINGDGWTDILILGFPGEESFWYENPKGKEGHWERHVAIDVTDNESPTFTDVTGDGKPEIVCCSRGYIGYAGPDPSAPTQLWKFHPVTPKGDYQRFTHGLGVGDVNGDRRMDILEKDGWWEQPASLAGDPVWTFHKFAFSPAASQMFAYDVDGDGKNDVITSLDCHNYGLVWWQQVTENGAITFKQHLIVGKEAKDNKYGVHFSQMHGIDLIDMDGDGLKDIVTGKRFWAHGREGDSEPNAPAVLYWFKLVRGPNKSVDFIPYQIDNDSGVGTQVAAGDVNGDRLPDVVVGNKKGLFVFTHQVKKVSAAEWKQAQPQPIEVSGSK